MATHADIALTRMRSKLQCKGSIIRLQRTYFFWLASKNLFSLAGIFVTEELRVFF